MIKKFIKTIAIASAALFGANANALTINYDVIDLMGISGDPSSGVSSAIEMDYLVYTGNSFTTVAPENGVTFLDLGHIETSTGFKDGSQLALTSISYYVDNGTLYSDTTTYTLSVTFTDWVGTYYDVVDDDNFSAYFTSGTASWDLTTTVTTTDLSDLNNPTVANVVEDTQTSVLVLDLLEGEGNITNGTGEIAVIFEVVSVIDDFLYVDVDNSGTLEEDEDLAALLAALTPEAEGYYLGYSWGTNTIIDSLDVDYAEELTQILVGAGLATPDGQGGYDLDPSVTGFVASNIGAIVFAEVPEPGMLSVMGLALLGLAGFQTRRRRRS